MDNELKIYEVTLRETGEKHYAVSDNAQDACKQAGWQIGDCYVNIQKARHRQGKNQKPETLVKVTCQVCPWQYAECRKPEDEECPVERDAPELEAWLKRITRAHLCKYVGEPMPPAQYFKQEKWIPLGEAIKELTAKG